MIKLHSSATREGQNNNNSTIKNDTGLSDGMINFICQYETGKNFGYKK